MNVGEPLSIGIALPQYRAGRPIVLDAVVPIARPTDIASIGYVVLDSAENPIGGVGAERAWPPRSTVTHPLQGWVYRAGMRLEIIAGVRQTAPGETALPGWRLRYHVGSKNYVATYRIAVSICAPRKRYACAGVSS